MENLIEELTKVNPSNLSEEGLKLFNTINEIIDRNKKLEKENDNITKQLLNEILDGDEYLPKSLIKEKIEEYKKLLMSCNRFSDVDRIKAINERILAFEELLTPLKNV